MSEDTTYAERTLRYIVEHLVDYPDEIDIEATVDSATVTLVARVAKSDMGRVIGRRGRVAHATRTLVRQAAVNDGLTAEVDFAD